MSDEKEPGITATLRELLWGSRAVLCILFLACAFPLAARAQLTASTTPISVYGGTSTYNNMDITTPGPSAATHTLSVSGPASVTVSNSLLTNDAPAAVVWANYGGSTTTFNNVTITSAVAPVPGAAWTYGIRIYGYEFDGAAPSSVTVNGVKVTVNTVDYAAVVQGGLATLNLQDSTLHSTTKSGLYVDTDNTAANLGNTAVISDAQAAAIIEYSGTLHATGSTFTGATDALKVSGGGLDPALDPGDVVTITGGTLTAQGGDAIHAVNTNADITLSGAVSVSASSGNLLSVETNAPPAGYPTASAVTLTADGLTATGNIIADTASSLNVNLINNTALTGAQNGVNIATTIDSTSAWNVNANSAIASLSNAGLVAFTAPVGDPTLLASYKTLTVNSYTGNGGTILFNTYLAGDGAASDRLVIDGGKATGQTLVQIHNTGGLGALTSGNGIMLIQAINNGKTTGSLFSLSGPVTAGAYVYTLGQGLDSASTENWYLRSTVQVGPAVAVPAAEGSGEQPLVVLGPTLPNYRMEVPVYMAAPALAERMGRTMLGTYHDRVGEDRLTGEAAQNMAGWLRVFGEFGHTGFDKGASNFASQGPSYDFGIDGVQLGFDALRLENENGLRHVAGLYGGYMHGHADVNQVYSGSKAGTVDMDAYSLGAYYTLKGAPGWYVDAALQPTWYTNAQARSQMGNKIHPNGFGLLASLEGGYPIQIGSGFALEPQAQIIYQHASLDNGSDTAGRVKYGDVNSWVGRLGVRATKNWQTQSGKKGTVWARVNVWHQMGDDAKTTFTNTNGQYPTRLKTSLGGTWGQVGLGVSGQLTQKLSAFAAGDYNHGLGNNNGHSLSGRIGLKYEF